MARVGSRGTSAVEVAVAVLVAAAIAVPMMGLMFQERDTEQRSRFEYVAILAARDEMFQARMLVALGIPPESVAHADFRALEGNPLEPLKDVFLGSRDCCSYSSEQKRVATKLTIEAASGATARQRLATVTARWLDPAAAAGTGRKSSVDLVFGVLMPPWTP